MKVKDLIQQLNDHYKPEDDIFSMYWDKTFGAGTTEDGVLSDDQWETAVTFIEHREYRDMENVNGEITEIIRDRVNEALED
jgi:hypothetical protein